jgi:hypothetical protein
MADRDHSITSFEECPAPQSADSAGAGACQDTVLAARTSAPRGARPVFEPPLWVRVTRIEAGGIARPLGIGQLLDPLQIGAVFRVATRSGAALVTSPVVVVGTENADTVTATTEHCTYRLERLAGSPRGRLDLSDLSATGGGTRGIALADAPVPGPGGFASGVRVRATRVGDGAGPDGSCRLLGRGKLLAPVSVGASLRFAVDGGISMVTSPVRRLEELSEGRLRVTTTNTTYQLELADDDPGKFEDSSAD